MRITSSSLSLAASHERARTDVLHERLEMWVGPRPGQEPGAGARAAQPAAALAAPAPPVTGGAPASAPATGAGKGVPGCGPDADGGAAGGVDGDSDRRLLDLMLLLRAFEHLDSARDGKVGARRGDGRGEAGEHAARVRRGVRDIQQAYATPAAEVPQGGQAAQGGAAPGAGGPPADAGWGLIYQREETHTEVERSAFAARGQVSTTDGRQIDFAVKLQQERVEVQASKVEVRAGDARKVDPLVLNLAGGSASFDGSHDFDLDGDGETESVARLAGGNAYLALDADGNGRIDSGRELFGPQSGDGFAELAARDGDGNGWIDEADAVWAQLRLWRPDAGTGAGALTTLAAAGVGAIATGSAATPFELRAADVRQGQADAVAHVARTGVYLTEQGQAGTVQHVDLVARQA